MSDVVFVTPAFTPSLTSECTGPLILARILQKAAINARILRFWEADMPYDNYLAFEKAFADLVCAEQPRIVTFFTRCDSYHISIALAKRIKQRIPSVTIVFGGPQAHLTARASVEAIPWLDYVCCGEGEQTIVPFFASILAGQPDESIAGLVYCKHDAVVVNPPPQHLEDGYLLDYEYYSFIPQKLMDSARTITVDAGRGCPFTCTFCSTKTFWQRHFRLRSPEDLLDHVEYLMREYGKQSFAFDHDLFTAKRARVMAFCDRIDQRGLKFTWSCSSRVDTLDEEMVLRMKESGFREVYLGVETGSSRMQHLIKKRIDVERVVPLATFMHNEGISVTASFIYGFPEETEEDFADTLRMMLALADRGITAIQLHELGFMEGTELFDQYRDKLEFGIYASEIGRPFGLHENTDLVRSNPQLFASFYGFPGTLCDEMRFAPDFVRCYKRVPKSMRYVVDLHGDDVLVAYRAFKNVCQSQLEDIRADANFVDYPTSRWIPLNIAMLNTFFESLRDILPPEQYCCLCDVYRYEKTLLLRNRGEGASESTEEYCFDWSALRRHAPLVELAKRTSTVRMQREGNSVRVKVLGFQDKISL